MENTQRFDINKVAQITFLFWILKIIATTLGETLGDYIAQTLNYGYTIGLLITLAFFLIVLSLQLFSKNYKPVLYWLVIIGTTTLGTEISDYMDRSLGLGYAWGSLILLGGLLSTLYFWKLKFKDLNVYPIFERSKEIYFWLAVLFSNSLGTAFGDFLTDNLSLTYLYGASITGLIILIVVLLHYYSKINAVILFWIAFIFTRPFGATFGDFLTKPLAKGGLDLGTLNASMVAVSLMIILLIFDKYRSKNIKQN